MALYEIFATRHGESNWKRLPGAITASTAKSAMAEYRRDRRSIGRVSAYRIRLKAVKVSENPSKSIPRNKWIKGSVKVSSSGVVKFKTTAVRKATRKRATKRKRTKR